MHGAGELRTSQFKFSRGQTVSHFKLYMISGGFVENTGIFILA